jgi:Domain of unknown function (DUF4440)
MESRIRVNLKIAKVPLYIAILMVFFGFQVFAEEWSAEQKEVWSHVEKYWESVERGNVTSAMSDFHEKSFMWSEGDPSPLKLDLIWKQHSRWLRYATPTSHELKPLIINIVNGSVANVFYYYKFEREGTVYNGRGQRLATWIKQDGKWVFLGSLECSCDDPAPCPYGW